MARAASATPGENLDRSVSAITLTQFLGLDLVPFAVALARVTLMLAKELELHEARKTENVDGLLVFEKPLPLANLDAQIDCADALFADWPAADTIIGNPPYLGAKLLKPTYGADYVARLRKAWPQVPGMADFCVDWFAKRTTSSRRARARDSSARRTFATANPAPEVSITSWPMAVSSPKPWSRKSGAATPRCT